MSKKAANVDSVVGTARQYWECGNADALRGMKDNLKEVAGASLEATAYAVHSALLMSDSSEALEILRSVPFLHGETPLPVVDLLNSMEQEEFYALGLLLVQLSNVHYRRRDLVEVERLLTQADNFLRVAVAGCPPSQHAVFLALCECGVLKARVLWRLSRHKNAESVLDDIVDRLTKALANTPEEPLSGGIERALANALELWAIWEWNHGQHDTACRRIYRALSLLAEGPSEDEVRLGRVLYNASRIESSYSTRDFGWSIRLAEKAERRLRRISHPIAVRCVVQRLRGLIKADRIQEAERLAEEVRAEMGKIRDPFERDTAEGEFEVAELWIAQRRALEDASQWATVAERAEELIDRYEQRTKTEIKIIAGTAMIRAGDKVGGHAQGKRLLDQALRESKKTQRAKLRAHCQLGLAEYHLTSNRVRAAQLLSEVSRDLEAAGTRSTYLEAERERLYAQVRTVVLVDPEQTYANAKADFSRKYFEHHRQKAPYPENAVAWIGKQTGAGDSTIYGYLSSKSRPKKKSRTTQSSRIQR